VLRSLRARPCRLDRTEARVGLVDERDVVFGPRDGRDVAGAGAMQEALLLVAYERTRDARVERVAVEETVHVLGRRVFGAAVVRADRRFLVARDEDVY